MLQKDIIYASTSICVQVDSEQELMLLQAISEQAIQHFF
jgi:hypothetical protein